jgi:cytochrome c biogenesis protein CcmG/thiol:disulfide interchange protein DsbE
MRATMRTLSQDTPGSMRQGPRGPEQCAPTPRRVALYAENVRRRALPIFVSIAGACLIGLLVYGVTAQSASRSLDQAAARGERVAAPQPAHPLAALTGAGTSSLAAYHGKVVLLNFWASWCEPCETEAPMLERAQPRLLAHGATVLGVTYRDAAPDSQAFIRRLHLTYPNLRDSTGGFAEAYGTDQLPESFVIDRQGRVVAVSRGEIAQPFVNRALALAEGS